MIDGFEKNVVVGGFRELDLRSLMRAFVVFSANLHLRIGRLRSVRTNLLSQFRSLLGLNGYLSVGNLTSGVELSFRTTIHEFTLHEQRFMKPSMQPTVARESACVHDREGRAVAALDRTFRLAWTSQDDPF